MISILPSLEIENFFHTRRAIERLREGLFDPLTVNILTMDEKRLYQTFSKGLGSIQSKKADYLCIRGSYGQGKSHSLLCLRDEALAKGYSVSLVNLDIREVPFHQMGLVYREVMKNLQLPNGSSLVKTWKQWASSKLKKSSVEPQELLPELMPHRFKMLLSALVKKTIVLTDKQKGMKKFRDFQPKHFDSSLESVLLGNEIPIGQLKKMFKYREVVSYGSSSIACRGAQPYFEMLQGMGSLLSTMGCGGLVLLFDEGESISQLRVNQRSQSYDLLDQFFQKKHTPTLYPIFAFTDDFFQRLSTEKYDKVRHKKGEEVPVFNKNFSSEWDSLEEYQLQNFSNKNWDIFLNRLVELYCHAYHIESIPQEVETHLKSVLKRLGAQDARLTIKALIEQLDIKTQQQLIVSMH